MSYHHTCRKKTTKKPTSLHLYETPSNAWLMYTYSPSDLQWKRPASPSESLNNGLKLKSLLTNPSLVDTKPGNSIGLIKLIGSVCPERRAACQSNMDVSAVTLATFFLLHLKPGEESTWQWSVWLDRTVQAVAVNQSVRSWVFLTLLTTLHTSEASRHENNRCLE